MFTTRSEWQSMNHTLRMMGQQPLALDDGAQSTRSWWRIMEHSLRMTDYGVLAQYDGLWCTPSGWRTRKHSHRWLSMKHSLRMTEHEALTLIGVARQKCPQWVNDSLRIMERGSAIDWRALSKWLKYSSKHSNSIVDKEWLAMLWLHTTLEPFNFNCPQQSKKFTEFVQIMTF